MKTVCLDAGHGGHDSGAAAHGLRECDIALSVITMTKDLLEPYVDVVLTRSDDTFVSLSQRARISNERKADCFVSFHCNAANNPRAHGWEIFTSKGKTEADKLATCIGNRHAAYFPDQPARHDWSDGDMDKEANFSVLRKTKAPAVLHECGFISNKEESMWMGNSTIRYKMAKALAEGVLEYLTIEDKPEPDLTLEQRVARLERNAGIA